MIVENKKEAQDEQFENAESIVFAADITNEEANLFQLLKEIQGKRLISPEVKGYQDFLAAYSSSSGYQVFKGSIDALATSDIVISLGVWFQDQGEDTTLFAHKIIEETMPKFVYMHPIEDVTLERDVTQFIKYEVGSEEGVAALLAYTLLQNRTIPEDIEEVLEDFDIGYLSAESNVGEEELESMYESIHQRSRISLIVGSDLYTHPKAGQIAKLIALLELYAGVNVVCIPPAKNALGIAMACQIDNEAEGQTLFYESCKEGTFVNANKYVSMGYDKQLTDIEGLNSIASSVGLHEDDLAGYSNRLPQEQGFQAIDSGLNDFPVYKLGLQDRCKEFTLDEIDYLPVYDGALVYTYKVKRTADNDEKSVDVLKGSKQFALATKLQDGDQITYEVGGVKFIRVFKIDTHLKGVIALNPVFDIKLSADLISSYRFSRLAFEKINNQNIGNNDE